MPCFAFIFRRLRSATAASSSACLWALRSDWRALSSRRGLIERAVQALFVEGQVGEGFVVVAVNARGGECRVDLGVFGFDFAGGFGVAEGDHRVFEGEGPV